MWVAWVFITRATLKNFSWIVSGLSQVKRQAKLAEEQALISDLEADMEHSRFAPVLILP